MEDAGQGFSGLHEGHFHELLSALRQIQQPRGGISSFLLGMLFTMLAIASSAFLAYAWYMERQHKQQLRSAAEVSDTLDGRRLKEIVGEFWPHVTAAAGKVVREQVEPKLAEAKPPWMSDLRLATFTLGPTPPRVNAIKVYRKETLGGEVIMELDFMWAGKQRAQLLVKPLPKLPLPLSVGSLIASLLSLSVGVQDIYVAGRVRLSCKPLLGRIPIVGAVKVSLVEQPTVSYGIVVQGGDISFLPGLEAFINNFLRDHVLQPYILPEGVSVPLDPSAGRANLPQGILHVKLIGAENVPRTDLLTGCDPYVVLFVRGRKKRRSQVRYHTRQPRWEEEFTMLVHDPDVQQLVAVLRDHNTWGNDEEVGRLTVPIRQLPAGEAQDLHLQLGPSKGTNLRKMSRNPLRAGVQGLRTVEHFVDRRIVSPLLGASRLEPCRLHMALTFYRVGAQEVTAAAQDTPIAESHAEIQAAAQGSQEGRQLVNMLRGGVLSVTVRKGFTSADALQDESSGSGGGAPDASTKARQVCVRVGGQEKCTAEARGKPNPEWEEALEFALSGNVVDSPDAHIECAIWDYHWVNAEQLLTWGSRAGRWESFSTESHIRIPLQEVLRQREVSREWELPGTDEGCLDMTLSWYPILETS